MVKETVLLRVRTDTRDSLRHLAGDLTMARYLDDLIKTLAKDTQPRLESLKGEFTMGDVKMAIGELALQIEMLIKDKHFTDGKIWQAFLDGQKQNMAVAVTLGQYGSAIEQLADIPGLRDQLAEEARPLVDKMWREHCRKVGWQETTEDEGPEDANKN